MASQKKASIFIIDDNKNLVDSFVTRFQSSNFKAEGCSNPSEILNKGERQNTQYDVILLDMYLGKVAGEFLNAPILIPHLRTYYPNSKIVIYSSGDIDKSLCLRSMQLGALTILPKTTESNDLIAIANVFAELREERDINEKLINLLWETVNQTKEDNPLKGKHLEMLIINLFESIPNIRVIGSNIIGSKSSGEFDILIENNNSHAYWRILDSPILIIECKNRIKPSTKNDIIILADKVKSKGNTSKVGILVSMSNISAPAKDKIIEVRKSDNVYIFTLTRKNIEELITRPFCERESYLRDIFSHQ